LASLWPLTRERFEQNRIKGLFFYLAAAATLLVTGLDTGFSGRSSGFLELALIGLLLASAGFVLILSLVDLASYFFSLPSISKNSDLFLQVHASHLLHPLKTSIILGLAALCLYTRSRAGGMLWVGLLALHLLQTILILHHARRASLVNGPGGLNGGSIRSLFSLMVGADRLTRISGVKTLYPRQMLTLPKETWIIDVRTRSEFHWNRLQGAENYPWGKGVVEAGQGKLKNRPVLVMCLSGHRSPAIAVRLRKMGFSNVYHLKWGLLYLILLGLDAGGNGPFSFSRSHPDPGKRPREGKWISTGYLILQGLILILAPLESAIRKRPVAGPQKVLGLFFLLTGLILAFLSFQALGRNFRIHAQPRPDGSLVSSGIYSKIRHPMYLAAFALFGGWILFFGSLWTVPLWVAFSILYILKVAQEERLLAEQFPAYREYRRRTWRFLPYIY
jgi:protein-S-isoprenylcysteine O-methyltransferase Ste14/rhodanese-related sulfurtransferase